MDCKQSERVFSNSLTCCRCSAVATVTVLQSSEVCVWDRYNLASCCFTEHIRHLVFALVNAHTRFIVFGTWVGFRSTLWELIEFKQFCLEVIREDIISGKHILLWCNKGVCCLPLYLPVDVLFCIINCCIFHYKHSTRKLFYSLFRGTTCAHAQIHIHTPARLRVNSVRMHCTTHCKHLHVVVLFLWLLQYELSMERLTLTGLAATQMRTQTKQT